MSTAVYDSELYDQSSQYKDDARLFAQFFVEPVQNKIKSDLEGRPVFDEVVMIRIVTPGSRDVMVTKATEQYKQRFARQWAAFEQRRTQVLDGTPLEQVPFLTVGQVAELKGLNIFTLEQLATLNDNVAQRFMGFHSLKQRAQNFLSAAKNAAPLTQLQAELEERDNTIALLKAQVQELSAKVAQMSAPQTSSSTSKPTRTTNA